MRHFILIFFILLTGSTVAQVKSNTKTVQGTWFASKTIIDPKVGLIKLIRVGHDTFGHGTFIDFKDTTSFTMYYSPMCGNDCFWNYSGNYSVRSNKLSLKFNTYTQHGMCKSLTKSYNKTQMKFVFLVESVGKDTLVLKDKANKLVLNFTAYDHSKSSSIFFRNRSVIHDIWLNKVHVITHEKTPRNNVSIKYQLNI